jgi:hypothetical protein
VLTTNPKNIAVLVSLALVPALVLGLVALGFGVRDGQGGAAGGAPTAGAKPSGVVAEAAGLLVTFDGEAPGLTIFADGAPADGAGAASRASAPVWREVVRLESRAKMIDGWQVAVPTSTLARAPSPIVRQEADNVIVHLEGIQIGDALRSSWSLTLSRTSQIVTLDRVETLIRPSEVVGTALVATGGASLARDRLVLVGGTAYTLTEAAVDRLGNHGPSGVVHRDPALSFTVTSREFTHARGERTGERDALFLTTDRRVGAGSATVQTSARLHIGARVPLQQATSSFNPALERFLLAAGYYGNIFVSQQNGTVLTASMMLYPESVWARDVAMAARGYLHVLPIEATEIFRNTLQQFLQRTSASGVVPEYFNEAGKSENRYSWDPMPDLIHGVYAYVSKTRDVNFLTSNIDTLERVLGWIRALDTDDDGLPDRDIYPYGYFDSVENGVMHTYAIASFYAAFLEMAELQEMIGRDGTANRAYAERMRFAFNRPLEVGGFWQTERGYPIAWKKSDGRVVSDFETFGVLAAIQVGLIVEPERLDRLAQIIADRRGEFVNDNAFPVRLMLGGYDSAYLRAGVRAENAWLLDANAPWITALDVAVRAQFGAIDDAASMLLRYEEAAMQYPPMPEFGAAIGARHGHGESHDGGRLWDNSAWFDIVYGTHYGLRMTPRALIIQPNPLRRAPDDTATEMTYQGMRFRVTVQPDGYTLTVLDGGMPRTVIFQPAGRATRVSVNNGHQQPSHTILVKPGETYSVRSYGAPR